MKKIEKYGTASLGVGYTCDILNDPEKVREIQRKIHKIKLAKLQKK